MRDEDHSMMFDTPLLLVGPLSLSWCLILSLSTAEANTLPGPQDCELARAKCAYRGSCYKSLHSYMVDCADVLAGRTTRCPWACQRALISLTSTDYGLALSECNCGDNEFCSRSKERIEVCRPAVSHATADDTVVSCTVAKWICAADTLCSTALDFYHRLCRPMFHGRKCTPRCNNSLAILDRQEKAGKLRDCYCDGTEDFPCVDIKQNTQRLCYGREGWNSDTYFPVTTQSGADSVPQPCLMLYLLVCSLLLLTFRTSEGVGQRRMKVLNTVEVEHSREVHPTEAKSRRMRTWPWWWTSEAIH